MNGKDPFASTSKALGRAAERRGQRGDRRKSRDENDGRPASRSSTASTGSFDSSSQPPPLPSRNGSGARGYPETPSSSKVSARSNMRSAGRSRDTPSSLLDSTTPMSSRIGEKSILDVLPPEYRYNPKAASPVLSHLQKSLESKSGETKVDIPLETLLSAADNDVRLHRARVQAGIEQGKIQTT